MASSMSPQWTHPHGHRARAICLVAEDWSQGLAGQGAHQIHGGREDQKPYWSVLAITDYCEVQCEA
jgi:hypothetical protein